MASHRHWVVYSLTTRKVLRRVWNEDAAEYERINVAGDNGVGPSADCSCWAFWRKLRPAPLVDVDQEGLLHIDGCSQGTH